MQKRSAWRRRMERMRRTPKKSITKQTPKQDRIDDRGPLEEQVRLRAYELYLARGTAPGHEIEDWLQAERDLRRDKR
jgi:hypothetical protein